MAKSNMVKARSLSTMQVAKKKVEFVPTKNNEKRMAGLNKENRIRNVNNIMRFESLR